MVDPSEEAERLYKTTFYDSSSQKGTIICTAAPGRVNLIGEHVDYTGGYVLPIAIEAYTAVYGSATFTDSGLCQIISSQTNEIVEFNSNRIVPFDKGDEKNKWANYVLGVVKEYVEDHPKGQALSLQIAIAGNVPLGSGLSSSASLEVAVATFVETFINHHHFQQQHPSTSTNNNDLLLAIINSKEQSIARAIKCQHSENTFCGVPCGIMDQFVSSAGVEGCALLIDCESNDFVAVSLGGYSSSSNLNRPPPVIVVTNSNVTHSLGDGEYPIRVEQCKEALNILQEHVNKDISSLRHASKVDVEAAKSYFKSDVLYRRARHVVTENERTLLFQRAMEEGDAPSMGLLMNGSHTSMRDDYEVSCKEIDILVEVAQAFDGVYGSRLTGGGFGGCTVTLVREDRAQDLITHLKEEYKTRCHGMECTCFITNPGKGARIILIE